MILSNIEIQRALDDRRLIIDPLPSPLKFGDGTKSPFQTSAVDLRLGDLFSYMKDDRSFAIDLTRGNFKSMFMDNSITIQCSRESPFVLRPGKLVLGQTLERVAFPLVENSACLAARVEGRSSFARCGLLVHFTAPTVHAGFSGSITLELINLGPCDLLLVPGTPICQLIVEEVKGTPSRIVSQFQGQSKPGGAS